MIREMDVSNGSGLGVSLFVQGCHFHCYGCFNQETWDFNGGKEWTREVEDVFVELAGRDHIDRISILGGEPLADENVNDIYRLVRRLKTLFPHKAVWIFTGYTIENLCGGSWDKNIARCSVVGMADVVADGRFVMDMQDINHKQIPWVGSTNQRVINVKETICSGEIQLKSV